MTDVSNSKLGRQVLGRGLGALLPEHNNETSDNKTDSTFLIDKNKEKNSGYFICDINLIETSSKQPRKTFNDNSIQELSQSIKETGVLQPLLLRKSLEGKYTLVAGERRLRASKLAGLTKVPVIVKELSDRQVLQSALIENIQREDLNPVEEAESYQSLMQEYNMTQEDLSKALGKNRSSIANYLRLLKLPVEMKQSVIKGELSMGHARTLVGMTDIIEQREVFYKIKENALSVRDTENLVKNIKSNKTKKKSINGITKQVSPVEKSLQDLLRTKVKITGTETKGKFVIEYYSKTDFDRLLSVLYGEEHE